MAGIDFVFNVSTPCVVCFFLPSFKVDFFCFGLMLNPLKSNNSSIMIVRRVVSEDSEAGHGHQHTHTSSRSITKNGVHSTPHSAALRCNQCIARCALLRLDVRVSIHTRVDFCIKRVQIGQKVTRSTWTLCTAMIRCQIILV